MMAKSVLQEEIGKKNPFDSLEQETALNLCRTMDHLQQDPCRLFQEHGLSGPQYNVLRILRGHSGDGLSCCEIAADMITRTPDITRLVDRLEQAGWVERRRHPDDRRIVRVKIMPAGLELLSRLDKPIVELHERQLGHLSRAELVELNRLLVKARRPE
ncbi:MAG TPA: MarR family transcriptional regulator [Gemmataceae bacterium]|nr:MarR family transcriptional regulator [Gemmataceae bacterium]